MLRFKTRYWVGGWLLAAILVPELALITIALVISGLFWYLVLYQIYIFFRMLLVDSSDNAWYNPNEAMGYHRSYDGE